MSNVCKALGNVEIRDIDKALSQVAQKQEVADWDAWISQLTWEKEELQTRLLKAERDLKLKESKTQRAHRLIGLLEEHIQNPGDLVTKARIYDEAVAKTGSVTALKLIHICVDHSAKMETILVEMRALFAAQNYFFWGSPVPLEKVPDLTEFPDLLPTEVLQNLQKSSTLRTNQESMESGERQASGSDAKTNEAERTKSKEAPTPASVPTTVPETPISILIMVSKTSPLPADAAPAIPSPPAPFSIPVNPEPSISLPILPLSETIRMYVESVRRQAVFIQTPEF